VPKTQKTTHAEEVKNFEDLIQNKQDIIGTSGSFSGVTAVSNAAPFDRETKAMMTGKAYKFSANSAGEINAKINFKTNGTPFTVKTGESAYVWLYFPEVTLFELKLGFYNDAGKGMYWHFDTDELISELNNNGKKLDKFMRALKKGYNYLINATDTQIVDALKPSFSTTSDELILASVKNYIRIGAYASSFELKESSWNNMLDIIDNAGELTNRVAWNDAVNNSFAVKVN
jgi:NitT/TauT family transport system substrate-binding protein